MEEINSHTEIIREQLGGEGRLLSESKIGYMYKHPKGKPIFNANIITSKGKVWFGDIDLNYDRLALKTIAGDLNERIYILKEMDGRFGNEKNELKKLRKLAIAIIKP